MSNFGKLNIDDLMAFIRDHQYIRGTGESRSAYKDPYADELPRDLIAMSLLSPAQSRQAVSVYEDAGRNDAFARLLDEMIREHGNLPDPEIYKRANLNRDTFWRIRNNGDTKNRDWVIAIAFAIGLSEQETERLLKACTRKRQEPTKEEKAREGLLMWFFRLRDEGEIDSFNVSDINEWLADEFKAMTGKDIKLLGNAVVL
jgi:hypothetical protein